MREEREEASLGSRLTSLEVYRDYGVYRLANPGVGSIDQ